MNQHVPSLLQIPHFLPKIVENIDDNVRVPLLNLLQLFIVDVSVRCIRVHKKVKLSTMIQRLLVTVLGQVKQKCQQLTPVVCLQQPVLVLRLAPSDRQVRCFKINKFHVSLVFAVKVLNLSARLIIPHKYVQIVEVVARLQQLWQTANFIAITIDNQRVVFGS